MRWTIRSKVVVGEPPHERLAERTQKPRQCPLLGRDPRHLVRAERGRRSLGRKDAAERTSGPIVGEPRRPAPQKRLLDFGPEGGIVFEGAHGLAFVRRGRREGEIDRRAEAERHRDLPIEIGEARCAAAVGDDVDPVGRHGAERRGDERGRAARVVQDHDAFGPGRKPGQRRAGAARGLAGTLMGLECRCVEKHGRLAPAGQSAGRRPCLPGTLDEMHTSVGSEAPQDAYRLGKEIACTAVGVAADPQEPARVADRLEQPGARARRSPEDEEPSGSGLRESERGLERMHARLFGAVEDQRGPAPWHDPRHVREAEERAAGTVPRRDRARIVRQSEDGCSASRLSCDDVAHEVDLVRERADGDEAQAAIVREDRRRLPRTGGSRARAFARERGGERQHAPLRQDVERRRVPWRVAAVGIDEPTAFGGREHGRTDQGPVALVLACVGEAGEEPVDVGDPERAAGKRLPYIIRVAADLPVAALDLAAEDRVAPSLDFAGEHAPSGCRTHMAAPHGCRAAHAPGAAEPSRRLVEMVRPEPTPGHGIERDRAETYREERVDAGAEAVRVHGKERKDEMRVSVLARAGLDLVGIEGRMGVVRRDQDRETVRLDEVSTREGAQDLTVLVPGRLARERQGGHDLEAEDRIDARRGGLETIEKRDPIVCEGRKGPLRGEQEVLADEIAAVAEIEGAPRPHLQTAGPGDVSRTLHGHAEVGFERVRSCERNGQIVVLECLSIARAGATDKRCDPMPQQAGRAAFFRQSAPFPARRAFFAPSMLAPPPSSRHRATHPARPLLERRSVVEKFSSQHTPQRALLRLDAGVAAQEQALRRARARLKTAAWPAIEQTGATILSPLAVRGILVSALEQIEADPQQLQRYEAKGAEHLRRASGEPSGTDLVVVRPAPADAALRKGLREAGLRPNRLRGSLEGRASADAIVALLGGSAGVYLLLAGRELAYDEARREAATGMDGHGEEDQSEDDADDGEV